MPSAIHASVSMLKAPKVAFGITSAETPVEESAQLITEAGCKPVWRGVYVSAGGPFELSRLTDAAGIPIVTLQPQDPSGVVKQLSWTTASVAAGKHDAQLRSIAETIVEYGDLVVLRYAPEMNGNWSPWGVVDGNTPAQYVDAWRHVVTLFRQAGASNVLWLWAPNIVRGAAVHGIAQFWPGDSWVDLVGFTGYGVESSAYGIEKSASATFDSTMQLLKPYSAKPVVLAEMGVSGATKDKWINSLGPWLDAHSNVIGLVWTDEKPPEAHDDWRFDDNSRDLMAFKSSVVPRLRCGT
jgi:hypothetical protein